MQFTKSTNTAPNKLAFDIHIYMKSGKSYPTKLQTYIVFYGIKGLQSDVPSNVYDALWNVENGKVVFNDNISMGNYAITNLKDAVNNNDAVNKSQFDAVDAKFNNYYDKTQTDAKFTNYYDKTQIDSKLTNYYDKTQIDSKFTNYYDKTYIDNNCYQPGLFFNKMGHDNSKTVIFPFNSNPPIYFPKNDLSDYYHDIGGGDNALMEVKKDGVYQIHFCDFYKNSGSGTKRVILRKIKRHDGNKEEKITMSYLDGSSSWMRLSVFHIVRLRNQDNIGIITERVILDGEEFSQFSIKKIGS